VFVETPATLSVEEFGPKNVPATADTAVAAGLP